MARGATAPGAVRQTQHRGALDTGASSATVKCSIYGAALPGSPPEHSALLCASTRHVPQRSPKIQVQTYFIPARVAAVALAVILES